MSKSPLKLRCSTVWRCVTLFLCLLAGGLAGAHAEEPSADKPIAWVPWSDGMFAQAKREHKFVLLDLEAVWCHWCHVMDTTTYADPDVRKMMNARYIAVKVDQDSRPDISNRYEDYGWPATVVFDADGKEIVKRQGYLPPGTMISMLQAIVDDPTPGPSVATERPIAYATGSSVSSALLARVRKIYASQYDVKAGGWGFSHKFLDGDSVEYALMLAREGDSVEARRVRDTLRLEQKIQDPVWGGAYQYSAGGDWDEPHFEKLISIQAQVMRTYALAYAQFKDAKYLAVAQSVHRYLKSFLTSPDGAFYVSQDADLIEGQHSGEYFKLDDAGRRRLGVPRVDKHVYARENGWMIAALADLYAVSGSQDDLTDAVRSAEWVLANRALPGGGFRHDESDAAGPYLGDTVAMGQAFLSLYKVTADERWLELSKATLPFLAANFSSPNGSGYVTSKAATDSFSRRFQERDENVAVARFSGLMFQYTGDAQAQAIANQAMRYLATPAIAVRWLSGGELLAIYESTHAPLHITIVGQKDDPDARRLFTTALQSIRSYERLEWMVGRQTAAARNDVVYPMLTKSAAFVCHENRCGDPIFLDQTLTGLIEKSSGAGQ
jgi:uncharacterized protein YyaL (SSP411 family)